MHCNDAMCTQSLVFSPQLGQRGCKTLVLAWIAFLNWQCWFDVHYHLEMCTQTVLDLACISMTWCGRRHSLPHPNKANMGAQSLFPLGLQLWTGCADSTCIATWQCVRRQCLIQRALRWCDVYADTHFLTLMSPMWVRNPCFGLDCYYDRQCWFNVHCTFCDVYAGSAWFDVHYNDVMCAQTLVYSPKQSQLGCAILVLAWIAIFFVNLQIIDVRCVRRQ